MPCLVVLFLIGLPRLALLCAWLMTGYTQAAFHTRIWPILGFFFMPYTTVCYMWAAVATNQHITGGWVLLIGLGVFLDLVVHGSSKRRKRRRK